MKLLAKPILEDKFWIVEAEDGSKRGTIQRVDNGNIRVFLNAETHNFACFESALNNFGIETSTISVKKPQLVSQSVEDYPAKDQPYNITMDAKSNLPMYTKTEKSRCFYAAGYYIISFDFGWAQAYCPKVITLKRNDYRGPYKSEMEMKEQLRIHNGKN